MKMKLFFLISFQQYSLKKQKFTFFHNKKHSLFLIFFFSAHG